MRPLSHILTDLIFQTTLLQVVVKCQNEKGETIVSHCDGVDFSNNPSQSCFNA